MHKNISVKTSLVKLSCPIDGFEIFPSSAIDQNPKMICVNNHSFDVSKNGYINLLNVKDKRSKDPGDSKEMILARSRILKADLFQPIAERLNAIVKEQFLLRNKEGVILDAGCGNGYYLKSCQNSFAESFNVAAIGLDISKWAIQEAAKGHSAATWLVASNRKPPIMHHSVDVIICGFGFPEFPAFKDILKPNGCVIMLDPAEQHLIELRRIIYPLIKEYTRNDFTKALSNGFHISKMENLKYSHADISQQQINDLLTMSPHLYKASHEGKNAAKLLGNTTITLDVNFTLLAL